MMVVLKKGGVRCDPTFPTSSPVADSWQEYSHRSHAKCPIGICYALANTVLGTFLSIQVPLGTETS